MATIEITTTEPNGGRRIILLDYDGEVEELVIAVVNRGYLSVPAEALASDPSGKAGRTGSRYLLAQHIFSIGVAE